LFSVPWEHFVLFCFLLAGGIFGVLPWITSFLAISTVRAIQTKPKSKSEFQTAEKSELGAISNSTTENYLTHSRCVFLRSIVDRPDIEICPTTSSVGSPENQICSFES
jgi:hypothetical protein